ncbi:MAG: hypothetical protein V4622_04200 [Bacteroidota bacterium]
MDTFLNAIGWWNFFGSFIMLGFLHEPFGHNILNKWTKIFFVKYKLNYWSRLWLFWAAGINVFFGAINIYGSKWHFIEVKHFLIYSDLLAYSIFLILVLWGIAAKKLAAGAASVIAIFCFWLAWGIFVLN